jgi:hypothetical protein
MSGCGVFVVRTLVVPVIGQSFSVTAAATLPQEEAAAQQALWLRRR